MNMNQLGIILQLIVAVTCLDETIVVKTPLGLVQGNVARTAEGVIYHTFNGIPYAKPPVGNLRFKPPESVEAWKNVLIADNDRRCLQIASNLTFGSEDCLYVYVSAPEVPKNKNERLPVMVFIHGGAFGKGTGNPKYSGRSDYFMNKEVIVVKINYRVGPFGFLSTEDKHAPGNYGLLDQLAALKWVQQNIAAFNGNPDKVTIFGVSAGGASVLYHMLSPLSKGLFHRAIPQSGSPLNPWARTRIARRRVNVLAEKLGCPIESSIELLKCLRNKDGKDILAVAFPTGDDVWGESPFVWVPRVDSESEMSFLPKDPFGMLLSGNFNKVPVMTGFTRDEGLYCSLVFPFMTDYDLHRISSDWQNVCAIFLNAEEFTDMKENCENIRSFYVDSEKINDIYNQAYIDLFGAVYFTAGIYKTAELIEKFVPTYVYSFDFYSRKTTLMRTANENAPILGVPHSEDELYLFNQSLPQIWEIPEKQMVDLMVTPWSNFAKNGFPSFKDESIDWPKFEPADYSYVSLNLPPSVKHHYKPHQMRFWENIFKTNYFMEDKPVDRQDL